MRGERNAWFASLVVLALTAALSEAGSRPVPVPPTLEIEVLDPGVDPVGNPAVIPNVGPDGITRVATPPTVLVHRYYYTGDRSFQAQLLPGGPCIVVVNHPKKGERLYVPVTFPPGAPRVIYRDDSIEYDYGTQGVTISFCWLLTKPKVTYRQGVPLTTKAQNAAASVYDATKKLIARTNLPDCTEQVYNGTKNAVVTTVDRATDLKQAVLAPPTQIIRSTPLGNLFTSSPEQRAIQERDTLVRRAQGRAERQDVFIPTNR